VVDLTPILNIRSSRLDDLRKQEQKSAVQHAAARAKVDEAQKQVQDYADEVRTLEVDLLRELLNTELTGADFTKFQSKLDQAEKKAKRLAEEHREAREEETEAERELLDRQRDRTVAQSKANRIGELKKILDEERRAEAIRKEDAEGDEFIDMMPRRTGGL
jgi:chromosome segregation ATPase